MGQSGKRGIFRRTILPFLLGVLAMFVVAMVVFWVIVQTGNDYGYISPPSFSADGFAPTINNGVNNIIAEGAVRDDIFNVDAEAPKEDSNLFEGQKLIKTVELSVETKEWDKYTSFVSQEVVSVGGYAEYSDYYTNADTARWRRLTLRVPVDKLDILLDKLSEQGNVLRQTSKQENVTLQYTDTEAQRDALIVERDRLMELLEMAETVDELLVIEDRLTNVRYQLDSQERQLCLYDNQIEYATIQLTVQEVRTFTETDQGFWERVGEELEDKWTTFMVLLEGLAIFFLSSMPIILVFVAVAVVIIITVLAVKRKRKKKTKFVDIGGEDSSTD